MNIVRCTQCGEIADYEKRQTCRGCGEPLSAEAAGKRPRQISAVQREASDDLNFSQGMLIALAAAAGLGATLFFTKDFKFMGAFLAAGLVIAFLIPILRWMKRRRTATPEVPAGGAPSAPKDGPLPPAAAPKLRARPSSSRSDETFVSALERGCGMVLKIVGIFIAVVVGLAALGFLVLWIACMTSSQGHF